MLAPTNQREASFFLVGLGLSHYDHIAAIVAIEVAVAYIARSIQRKGRRPMTPKPETAVPDSSCPWCEGRKIQRGAFVLFTQNHVGRRVTCGSLKCQKSWIENYIYKNRTTLLEDNRD